MRTLAAILLATILPATALAQTATVITPGRYDPAPWWMAQPIIASTGYVKADVLANRASFSASFQVVGKNGAGSDESRRRQGQGTRPRPGRL